MRIQYKISLEKTRVILFVSDIDLIIDTKDCNNKKENVYAKSYFI